MDRVDEPQVAHALAGVDLHLPSPIDGFGRGREHFARPVGREVEERLLGKTRHFFAPPSGDIRNQNVGGEVELGLVENPPAFRGVAPAWFGETVEDGCSQTGGSEGMPWGRPWKGVQVAVEDLSHQMFGQREDILVARHLAAWCRAHQIQINTRHVV
jgi:hypothetical protein